jgi:hypothetical protein
MAVSTNELESGLEELIVALDRRVPRVEQAGEAGGSGGAPGESRSRCRLPADVSG